MYRVAKGSKGAEIPCRLFYACRQEEAEKDHSDYLKEQEESWTALSLYAIADKNGCSGEEVIRDETQDVEAEAILRMETEALRRAITLLDSESYRLIYALYLASTQKTERELAHLASCFATIPSAHNDTPLGGPALA